MSAVKAMPSLGEDLAKRWYVPLEVETLRLVQPAVVLINALALGLAVLRDNGDARPVATLILFTHAVTWILLRELVAGRRGLRDGLLLSAGATLALSVWAHMLGPDLWVDRWFSLWSIAPAGLVMWNLSTPVVAHWCTGRLSTAGAERAWPGTVCFAGAQKRRCVTWRSSTPARWSCCPCCGSSTWRCRPETRSAAVSSTP